jgi:hypothetical protein
VIADHLNEVQFLLNLFYLGANFVRAILCIRGGASSSLRLRRKLVHLGASSSEKIRQLFWRSTENPQARIFFFYELAGAPPSEKISKLTSSQARKLYFYRRVELRLPEGAKLQQARCSLIKRKFTLLYLYDNCRF